MMPSTNSRASQNPRRSVSSLSNYPSTGNRPGSSLSVASLARPLSRASTQRPKSRQRISSAKLLPLCDSLIHAVVGPNPRRTADADADDETERDQQEIRHRELVDFAMRNLSMEGATISKAAATFDKERVDSMIRGHVEKARIRSSNTLAQALETCYNKLTFQVEKEKDLDVEINESRLPAHMQLVLALSQPPQPSTLTRASLYLDSLKNPPAPAESSKWTWEKILAEEPFEGDHWIGVPGGIPISQKHRGPEDGDRDNDEDEKSGGSTPSLSSLDTDDDLDLGFEPITTSISDEGPSIFLRPQISRKPEVTEDPIYMTHEYRQEVENLKTKQYWREDWQMDEQFDAIIHQRGTFNIGNASTLGPTLQRILPPSGTPPTAQLSNFVVPPLEVILSIEKYIYEHDAVREILIALQGRKNLLFEWKEGRFETTKTTPRLLHLSLASQQSILSVISGTCTVLQHLRNFTSFIILHSFRSRTEANMLSALEKNKARKITRTLEAFADSVDAEIRTLELWCARKEEMIIQATGGALKEIEGALVVSLLDIEKMFRDDFEESFDVLFDVVLKVVDKTAPRNWDLPNRSASTTTTLLLDTLFSTMQLRLERGDKITADSIMRVFVRSAEAVWVMVGKWLKNGFELGAGSKNDDGSLGKREPELEDEFFIESTGIGIEMGIIGLLDPNFWADGYGLRDDEVATSDRGQVKSIPSFLYHVASAVLETGKSVGLLKALDIDVSLLSSGGPEFQTISGWRWGSFRELVAGESPGHSSEVVDDYGLFSVSVDRLSQLIYNSLIPYSDAIRAVMARAIVQECDFWFHLHAIQAIYLMRRGDVISDFSNLVFAKMDAQQYWNDFHFLNTAFSDVVDLSNTPYSRHWLQTSLVRFSYRSNGDDEQSVTRTVKAIEGLSLEYAVPFPLTYVFTPRNIQVYGDIFVFLMQIRRSKSVLDRILVRGENGRLEWSHGLKLFYAMRSRLSWFINTILNFMVTNVIQTQVEVFREQLKQPRSLNHIIQLHDEHLKKIQGRCLLQPKTMALHQAIISVLDMAIKFNDTLVSFSGNASTHDISTPSVTLRHRSRTQRRRQKNVVGFTHVNWITESSDSDPEYTEDEKGCLTSLSVSVNTMFEDGNHFARVSKMSIELDGLVRFIRRGVETLACGTGDAAATFSVLAFTLEDWDL